MEDIRFLRQLLISIGKRDSGFPYSMSAEEEISSKIFYRGMTCGIWIQTCKAAMLILLRRTVVIFRGMTVFLIGLSLATCSNILRKKRGVPFWPRIFALLMPA